MKRLNEDVAINDPQLAQQYANGQTQLMNKDKQINALQTQINNIQKQKNEIEKAMAVIQQKAAQAQPKQPEQNTNNNKNQQTVQVTGQPVQPTSESLLVKENTEYNYIEQLSYMYNKLTDELATLMNNDPNNFEEIKKLKLEIKEISDELSNLEEAEENTNLEQREQEMFWRENEYNESSSPISKENFYNLNEDYIDTKESNREYEEYEDQNFIFYLKISDADNIFVAKVFKISPDGEWYGLVKAGEDKTFEKISYESNFNEDDIVNFLEDSYDEVEIIDILEFNEYIEDAESLDESYNESDLELDNEFEDCGVKKIITFSSYATRSDMMTIISILHYDFNVDIDDNFEFRDEPNESLSFIVFCTDYSIEDISDELFEFIENGMINTIDDVV